MQPIVINIYNEWYQMTVTHLRKTLSALEDDFLVKQQHASNNRMYESKQECTNDGECNGHMNRL